jgi:hypothetical protein
MNPYNKYITRDFNREPKMRIGLMSSLYESDVLPLNYFGLFNLNYIRRWGSLRTDELIV